MAWMAGHRRPARLDGPLPRDARRATGALAVLTPEDFTLTPIGRVESPLTDPAEAPKQGHEGGPDAWLVFDAGVVEGLDGIEPGARVIVLTWLDRARRDVLRVHPRDDPSNPQRGVFSTRSADRPNPIGLHEVEVLSVADGRVQVGGLEAVNGTPILDVKPVIQTFTRVVGSRP
jgi:tRNA-Thr(GGU) m(6)t(6)A37 methyltransferase TsaA